MAAVIHTVITCGIEPECFDRFFDAMAMDLTTTSYQTWEDLRGYMEGSAAVIGEMMLPVLEPISHGGEGTRPVPRLGLPAHQLPPRHRRGSRSRPRLHAARGSSAVRC